MTSARTIVAALILASFAFAAPALAQGTAKHAITNIAGDLYRFQNNFHYSVFLVTPDGVIVTDPINADAARWLKAEIKKRFDKPIKYLILSHDQSDHSAGGEVFADTATVIAHENAKATIIGEGRPTAIPDITFSDTMTVSLGGKADVADNRGYMGALYNGVLDGLCKGETLESLKASLTLDAYKEWGRYKEWRPLNIEGVYKRIELQRRAR